VRASTQQERKKERHKHCTLVLPTGSNTESRSGSNTESRSHTHQCTPNVLSVCRLISSQWIIKFEIQVGGQRRVQDNLRTVTIPQYWFNKSKQRTQSLRFPFYPNTKHSLRHWYGGSTHWMLLYLCLPKTKYINWFLLLLRETVI